jgi:hypothetical protein
LGGLVLVLVQLLVEVAEPPPQMPRGQDQGGDELAQFGVAGKRSAMHAEVAGSLRRGQ